MEVESQSSDSSQGLEGASGQAGDGAQPGETKAQAEARKLRVKVRGKEQEVDEQKVIADYQKYESARELFEKASSLENQTKARVKGLFEKLKTDPESVLSDPRLGIDLEALADKILKKKIESQLLTDEERERLKEKEELEGYRSKEQKRKDAEEQERFQSQVLAEKEKLAETVEQVMEGTILRKDPYTLRAAAVFMKACRLKGFDPSPEEIREAVENRSRQDHMAFVQNLEPEQIIEMYGQEFVQKILKHSIQKIRGDKRPSLVRPEAGALKAQQQNPNEKREDPYQARDRINAWANT